MPDYESTLELIARLKEERDTAVAVRDDLQRRNTILVEQYRALQAQIDGRSTNRNDGRTEEAKA